MRVRDEVMFMSGGSSNQERLVIIERQLCRVDKGQPGEVGAH